MRGKVVLPGTWYHGPGSFCFCSWQASFKKSQSFLPCAFSLTALGGRCFFTLSSRGLGLKARGDESQTLTALWSVLCRVLFLPSALPAQGSLSSFQDAQLKKDYGFPTAKAVKILRYISGESRARDFSIQ